MFLILLMHGANMKMYDGLLVEVRVGCSCREICTESEIRICKEKQLYGQLMLFVFLASQLTVGLYFTTLYRAIASSRTRFLDHTQRRATFGRTPLDE